MTDALLAQINRDALTPALQLLPALMDTPAARCIALALCLQESGLTHRVQMGNGPARGLGQFERGGGVVGVLTHPATKKHAAHVCAARDVDGNSLAVWGRLAHDDVLAMAFVRLLMYSDPVALPALGQTDEAWRLYLRTWRPGKPKPDTWPVHYRRALRFIRGEA